MTVHHTFKCDHCTNWKEAVPERGRLFSDIPDNWSEVGFYSNRNRRTSRLLCPDCFVKFMAATAPFFLPGLGDDR